MHAVAVETVEQKMARQRDGDEQPETQLSGRAHVAHGRQKAIRESQHERQYHEADNGVRVPAMVQQVADRRRSNPRVREIEIRQIRRDDARADEQWALRLRAPAPHGEIGEGDADEGMGDVVHDWVTGMGIRDWGLGIQG